MSFSNLFRFLGGLFRATAIADVNLVLSRVNVLDRSSDCRGEQIQSEADGTHRSGTYGCTGPQCNGAEGKNGRRAPPPPALTSGLSRDAVRLAMLAG
jgi:hypothetical protein